MGKLIKKWIKKKEEFAEYVSIEQNTEEFIRNFKDILRKGTPETVYGFVKFLANSIQGQLITKCLYNDRNYFSIVSRLPRNILLDLSSNYYMDYNKTIDIKKTPVISCIWKNKSMVDCLTSINRFSGEEFDGIKHSNNIFSFIVKPIGLVVVYGGNHSVNSAIVHGEGEITVKNMIDISPILEKYRFTGKEYVSVKSGKTIYNRNLKNGSEVVVYELGLMFEMSRVLKELGISLV